MTIWPRGVPQPKGSVSAFYDKAKHQMRRFDSNRGGAKWAKEVQKCAKAALLGWDEDIAAPLYPAGIPVTVHVQFNLPRPKKPKHKEYPLGKPDVDKLVRGVLDPLKGIVYADDAQVQQVLASKHWASPGMEGAIISVQSLAEAKRDEYAEAEGAMGV